MARRIAKDTEQVFSLNISCFMAQIIEVDKEMKHKILVHDVVPIFRLNIRKNSRAKTAVERNKFAKLFKAGPCDVLPPPASDWSNFSVAINQGVISTFDFIAA